MKSWLSKSLAEIENVVSRLDFSSYSFMVHLN